ncbi:mitochondrial adenyl nucleotide antiporter SLC25A24 [Chironomus tepperi]|uniref:mitochondrial adenyl nucleotide antiporter SLC25A24 n=1 Tax=Chironomus tepperi TaxID=113505 RepID=UPI00391FB7DC
MVLSGINPEDRKRYEELFKKLDVNNNGKIDLHDLKAQLGCEKYAQSFIDKSDRTSSGDVSLNEFIHYLQDQEKNLRLQFSHLDKNQDGKVDLKEMISSFEELGIQMDCNEAMKLFNRMDQDGSLFISFNEWRDFMILAPSTNIHDLIKYWRHSTYLDIGEDFNVPDDFTQTELETGRWWRHLVSGALAGAVSRTSTAPLDRLKVMLQVHHSKQRISECFKGMLKEGGWQGLWRGNGINVIKIAPETAIKFMVYEQVKQFIRGQENRPMSIFERFVAGAVAGCVSQTTIYPMEVLKTRLALRKTGQYNGMLDAAKKIYVHEGLRSFYRGYIPNILGIIPYAGIDLAVYETLKKKYLSNHTDQEVPQVWLLLACGSISSSLGQFCSYPLALVRTRLQAQTVATTSFNVNVAGISFTQQGKVPKQEPTMSSVFKQIIQKEGPAGLYRGITPNFVKVLPAVSISYLVYELVSNKLGVNMT